MPAWRAAVVAKRTSWQRFEEGGDVHVRSLIEKGDPSVALMKRSHDEHVATLRELEAAVEALGIDARFIYRTHGEFSDDDVDLVITVGGDGTLLAASHRVARAPVLGINSAPSSSIGFFCGGRLGNVESTLRSVIEGALPGVTLTRMEVLCNDRLVSSRVLNDALLCHASPAATSRYLLELRGIEEEQRSSGFWVGPAAGSTAAQRSAGGRVLGLDATVLQLVVREPYTPAGRRLALTQDLIASGEVLRARSKMHDAKLFLDGPHESYDLRLGDVVEFRRSTESLTVLGLGLMRRPAR